VTKYTLLALVLAAPTLACPSVGSAQTATVPTQPRYERVPAVPPPPLVDSVAERLYHPDNLIVNGPVYRGRIPSNVVWVIFHDSVAQPGRQSVVDLIEGVVVGGQYLGLGGIYYIEIEGDSTGHAIREAVLRLEAHPAVVLASPDLSLLVTPPSPLRRSENEPPR